MREIQERAGKTKTKEKKGEDRGGITKLGRKNYKTGEIEREEELKKIEEQSKNHRKMEDEQ